MNYYLVHAGMTSKLFNLINKHMAKHPNITVCAYKLDPSCAEYDAPFRQVVWSGRGLYMRKLRWSKWSSDRTQINWPTAEDLNQNRACIIHGHTPYCYLNYFPSGGQDSYGEINLFWMNQHIWFSEDLQSFNVDSNIKGRYEYGEGYRGLSCICLEVMDEIASQDGGKLTAERIKTSQNGVFSAAYVYELSKGCCGDITRITSAAPKMKTIQYNQRDQSFSIV